MTGGSTRKGVTAATPPRVTLLSLPDEILALVFAALHGRYQHRKIGMPPSHHLRICKRLYTIARPIWLSVLVVPTAKTDEYCGAKMLEHAAALAHIRDLELQLEVDPPSWKLALFPHLANLQTLRLREAPVPNRHQAGESYSEEVMIVLENLANLSGMQILSPNTTLTHVSGNSIIRRLDLPISSQTMRGVCMLEHLTLRIDSDTDTTDCMYEWENLEAIEFVIDRQLSETPQLFLRKLLMQVRLALSWSNRRKSLMIILVNRLVAPRFSKGCAASRSRSGGQARPTSTFARVSWRPSLALQSPISSSTTGLFTLFPMRMTSRGRL